MVQQHELLSKSRFLSALSLLGALALCTGCIGTEPEQAAGHVKLATHVSDWRDEVVYQLVTDRFANGDPGNDYRVDQTSLGHYQGGDYQGVVDKLDYLQELGVTALWISPIVKNVDADAGFDAYHGYWAVDLQQLNPHFGDLNALRNLVNEAHSRNMKVIVDIVTNHMGQVFYYDINNNGQPDVSVSGSGTPLQGSSDTATASGASVVSEYDPDYDPRGIQAFSSLGQSGPAITRFFDMPEIYRVPPMPEIFQRPESYHRRGRVTNWNDPNQVQFGDFPGGLKDINTEDPDVVAALTNAYLEWILKTDIDGFRIDTIKHVGMDFWQSFEPAVRQRLAAAGKTNFLMFGEAFDGDDTLVGSYTGQNQFDSVVYFPQTFQVFDGVFMNSGATSAIQALYDKRASDYSAEPQPGGVGVPPSELLVNFIDNHDVPRFLWQGGDVGALHAALAYLFTEQGLPCLYYGTEQRFHGGNDPNNREPLWWSGYDTSGDTFQLISKLIRTRKAYPALRHGSFDLTWTTDHTGTESDAGIVAFERKTPEGDYALVVINAQGRQASETSTLAAGGNSMKVSASANAQLVDALSGNPVTVAGDGTLDVQLQPDGVAIFVPADAYVP